MTVKRSLPVLMAAAAALLAAGVYAPSLRNDFVNWDDGLYVYGNPFIRRLDGRFLGWAFTTFRASNWHPLTWISHALDYTLWGLNPLGHHLTSVVLHAVNVFLVVLLAFRLIEAGRERMSSGAPSLPDGQGGLIAAGMTGLLFGIHPLHVESVAWVNERKDLLCALFFLLSILSYTLPERTSAESGASGGGGARPFGRHYLLSLIFFLLALLSKPMAVSLPLVLLVLDWYPFKRIRSAESFRTVFIEKIPLSS